MSICPLCNDPAQIDGTFDGRDASVITCARCGRFIMTGTLMAFMSGKDADERFKVSTYTRECQIRNRPVPFIFTEDNSDPSNLAPKGCFFIGWESIVRKFPSSVPEILDRALCNFVNISKPGEPLSLRPTDLTVAYAKNHDAWAFVENALIEEKLVARDHSQLHVTARGWIRAGEIERGSALLQYNQAFVAMWFDTSMNDAWINGFKLGIEGNDSDKTGIKAMRVDLKEHNEKICDVIVAEIRKSRFLVADFTGNRGGAYFEAGFAKGLGLPVIFSCQKGEWESKLHFDTRQYNHIIWETSEDLKIKLRNRILATIPPVAGDTHAR